MNYTNLFAIVKSVFILKMLILDEIYIIISHISGFNFLTLCLESVMSDYKRNLQFFLLWDFLLGVSVFTLMEHFTSDAPGHQMCEVFPQQAILHYTSWLSYNVAQFWHYLPEGSARSHGLRTQCHKTLLPTSDVNSW